MSAFVVSPATIDVIVTFVAQDSRQSLNPIYATFDEFGQDLFEANVRSVNHRYNEADEAPAYSWRPVAGVTPVQVLKALQCLEYQSCEVDGWSSSPMAGEFERIRSYAISALPGYDEAPWDFRDEDVMFRVSVQP